MSSAIAEIVRPGLALGSITPRLYTPPLVVGPAGPCGCGCALTGESSYGFREVGFAEGTLGRPKWAWQRWLSIHAGELTPEGFPRFRRVIVVVGRQCGKTREVEDLTLFWLFEDRKPSILGTSTLTKYAKKPWMAAFKLAVAELPERMPERPLTKAIRKAAGEEEWWTADDCHYAIAASNAEGGRSMTNHRVIADELAKQYNYDAYGAAYYSMDGVEDAQYFGLTTPDAQGVVFNDLRGAALNFIKTGVGDPTLALFEWSAPPDSDPTDLRALAMANPTLGRPGGKRADRMLNEARGAVAKGGDLLRTFKTEVMCIQVPAINPAVDPQAWRDCAAPEPVTMDGLRDRVACCVDVAPDSAHVTLTAAAVRDDGRVQVEVVEAWDSTEAARAELGALLERVKPYALGWYPSGPAAALAPILRPMTEVDGDKGHPRPIPMPWENVELTGGKVGEACQGFADLVAARRILHSDDPLLNNHVEHAQRYVQGDGWRFVRRGAGHVDGAYSVAGAAYVALTVKPKRRKPKSKVW